MERFKLRKKNGKPESNEHPCIHYPGSIITHPQPMFHICTPRPFLSYPTPPPTTQLFLTQILQSYFMQAEQKNLNTISNTKSALKCQTRAKAEFQNPSLDVSCIPHSTPTNSSKKFEFVPWI